MLIFKIRDTFRGQFRVEVRFRVRIIFIFWDKIKANVGFRIRITFKFCVKVRFNIRFKFRITRISKF